MYCNAKVGVGVPDALTVKATATPEVVNTGPGFAPKEGATELTVVVTLAVGEFGLVPLPFTARARK